jgi:hypothetical protein
LFFFKKGGSWDNVVGIATGYGFDDRGVGVRFPAGSRIFSSPRLPDQINPSFLTRGCYVRIMTVRVQLKKKFSGCEPQGAWCQDELIGGKPSVIK